MRKMPEQNACQPAKAVKGDIEQFKGSAGDEELMEFITQRVKSGEDESQN